MSSSKASFVLVYFAIIGLLVAEPRHAAESPAELYWKAKLGNTPIPTVLKDSLPLVSNAGTVNLKKDYGVRSYNPDGDQKNYNRMATYYPDGDQKNYNRMAAYYPDGDRINVIYNRMAASYAGNKFQDGRVMYFTDEVFSKTGAKLKLRFTKMNTAIKFLPLKIAKSLPVSSDKLQVILNMLSVNPTSELAEDISEMIKDCQDKGVKGEVRFCANSLEAMVDKVITLNFAKNNVKIYSAQVDKSSGVQEFTIKTASKIGNDKENVVCHRLRNPYAVFLCHNIKSTDAYAVSLVGANGQEIKAMAVCHKDTSSWHPKSLALQLLNLKPGTKPVCHFLNSEALVWVKN